MKPRQNWLFLIVFLVLVSLFLVACERPLPGGYNDPYTGPDTTAPEVPMDVPEVDSGSAYPAEQEPPADAAEAYPAEAVQPAEGYPAEESVEEQGLTAEEQPAGEEPLPDAGETEAAETEEAAPAAEAEPAPETEAPAEESEAAAPADNPGTHTVAAGENLYRIGLLYGINWLDLAEANGISDPTSLSVGQVLIIPSPDSEAGAEATAEEEETEEAAETEQEADTAETAPEETDEPGTYTVQAGDTLNKIGALLGVDWTEIAALNGIVGTQIYAGQVLIIPVPADEAAEPEEVEATGDEITYVVQEGDSIYSVAFEHTIPWTALVEANGLKRLTRWRLGKR